uniref:Uncharacterized protein n=1 Tax=Sphaerodactylus townsendi TaxID=933632 RepID=A0ACB8FDU9_9SAUR
MGAIGCPETKTLGAPASPHAAQRGRGVVPRKPLSPAPTPSLSHLPEPAGDSLRQSPARGREAVCVAASPSSLPSSTGPAARDRQEGKPAGFPPSLAPAARVLPTPVQGRQQKPTGSPSLDRRRKRDGKGSRLASTLPLSCTRGGSSHTGGQQVLEFSIKSQKEIVDPGFEQIPGFHEVSHQVLTRFRPA